MDSIEDELRFWADRLGFEKTVEVPHQGRLGFVILKRGSVELMLQSQASLGSDVAAIADGPHRAVLYCEVEDLAPIRRALEGWPLVTPERKTFYDTVELIAKDPAGHVVFFAQHT